MPHENTCSILIFLLARPRGIEPLTKNLEVSLNILLTQYNFIKFINFLASYIPTKNQSYVHLLSFRGAKLEQKTSSRAFKIESGRRRGIVTGGALFCKKHAAKGKKTGLKHPFFIFTK